jgi:uncharacterized protein (DUF362 family)
MAEDNVAISIILSWAVSSLEINQSSYVNIKGKHLKPVIMLMIMKEHMKTCFICIKSYFGILILVTMVLLS